MSNAETTKSQPTVSWRQELRGLVYLLACGAILSLLIEWGISKPGLNFPDHLIVWVAMLPLLLSRVRKALLALPARRVVPILGGSVVTVAALLLWEGNLPECAGTIEERAVCESIRKAAPTLTAALRGAGDAPRLFVQRIGLDHHDLRISRAVVALALKATQSFRGRLRVLSMQDAPTEVDRTGDLILSGEAEAWDPNPLRSNRFRAVLNLGRRLPSGIIEPIERWKIGPLSESERWPVIDHVLSREDAELFRGQRLRVARGETPRDSGCLPRPTRDCYVRLATDQSEAIVRDNNGLRVSRVIIEVEDLLFVSFDQYIPSPRAGGY